MATKVFTANSWAHLQDILFHDTWDEGLQRYRSSYVYRGLNNVDYPLATSLMRLGSDYPRLERHLLRNFKKYAHRNAAPGDSIWNWLAVAQHHGLPTRLLDWTYSPYVALHFATANHEQYNTDGIIWAVNYVETNNFLPPQLTSVIQEEGSNAFTAEMLESVCKTIQAFDQLQEKPFTIFLEPPSLDERIVNQHALFSLMSGPNYRLDNWLQDYPQHYFKIIIPTDLKIEIRDKLDQANITERMLFPGLNGLSVWLKRHYSAFEK